MPIFYLEPRNGDTSHARWASSSLKEGCWVRSDTPERARELIAALTPQVTDCVPGERVLYSPWLDGQLTDCRPDAPSLDIPEGIIVTVAGKTIS